VSGIGTVNVADVLPAGTVTVVNPNPSSRMFTVVAAVDVLPNVTVPVVDDPCETTFGLNDSWRGAATVRDAEADFPRYVAVNW
jgi:hypothetical protein